MRLVVKQSGRFTYLYAIKGYRTDKKHDQGRREVRDRRGASREAGRRVPH